MTQCPGKNPTSYSSSTKPETADLAFDAYLNSPGLSNCPDWLAQTRDRKICSNVTHYFENPKALNCLNIKGSGMGRKKQLSKELNPDLRFDLCPL